MKLAKSKKERVDWTGGYGYQMVNDLRDLIPQFKEFYYRQRATFGMNKSRLKIIGEFQKTIEPFRFAPYPSTYAFWYKKWDKDIITPKEETALKIQEAQLVRLKDAEEGRIIPIREDLDGASKTLAGALANDAMRILNADQTNEDIYTPNELLNRRVYVLNVMKYLTSLVHGERALDIKSNAEKREQAGFMIDILRHAATGKMTDEELNLLRGSIKPIVHVETQ